ncbi:alpha/beta hydrolase [Halobium salinum]|uniref:Alpha/beta hydrolase n=1 Tax=Halobium salinum TaxID=1364940 RepID=A0ABD5PE72_9EURY|nr:alpha/beta hydrolase [Halobium salinum]
MPDQLDRDAAEMLRLREEADLPDIVDMTPAEARALWDELAVVPEEHREPVDSVEERTVPGPDDRADEIPVRVYTPESVASASDDGAGAPVVVFFHGGGFVIGDLETRDATCRALANDADCVVVSVAYRLAPEHPFPAAVADAYAATEWVADNPDAVGGDGRLAVSGDSAGGTLAAVVTLLARDRDGPGIDYQSLIYPGTSGSEDWDSYDENETGYLLERSTVRYFYGHYFRHALERANPYAFPMAACSYEDLPPTTVLTCGFDPLRDEGLAYADVLESAGVDVSRLHYDDMIHGAITMLGEPGVTQARRMVEDLAADLRAGFETAE